MFGLPHESILSIVQAVGYPGLFAAVFLESGVFFGFFLPGSSMLFTAGLLAVTGVFNVWLLVPLLSIAAILGDSAGYWFGSRVGVSLFFRKDSRFFKHSHLERAKDFYDRHGMQAVFLARFVPIVRTFAPIIAGIVQMRYRAFLAYNIAGGVVWASALTFGGYFLGRHLPGIERYFTPIVLVIIIASMLPLFWELRKPKSDSDPR
jgi:membrane-associated protein